MSGGSYDYFYSRVESVAHSISDNSCCQSLSRPALRRAFRGHLLKVAAALRAIEWNDSGDGDDRETDLIRACLAPDAELKCAIERADEARLQLMAAITAAEALAKR